MLPVSNVEDLQVKYFKGDELLMEILKEARVICDLKYYQASRIGPLKRPPK